MPRISGEELPIVFAEAKNEKPRGAAIILATVLEAALEDCMCARLLPFPMSNTQRDILFGGEGGISRFSSKIDLGYSLGLYGPKTRADLHLIRKVRNEFAHYAPRDFSHPEIAKHCRNLTDYAKPDNILVPPAGASERHIKEAEEFNMRWRFVHCLHHIASGMYDETKNPHSPPLPTVLP